MIGSPIVVGLVWLTEKNRQSILFFFIGRTQTKPTILVGSKEGFNTTVVFAKQMMLAVILFVLVQLVYSFFDQGPVHFHTKDHGSGGFGMKQDVKVTLTDEADSLSDAIKDMSSSISLTKQAKTTIDHETKKQHF